MAIFKPIGDWTLRLEDSTLSGRVVTLADGAGRTRLGLAEKDCPTLDPSYWTVDTPTALGMAEAYYCEHFWEPLGGDHVNDQVLMATIYDYAVNGGLPHASKAVQTLLGVLPVDGIIGPHTIAAINAQDPVAFAARIRADRAAHDTAIAAAKPQDAIYLHGWLNRANLIYPALL
jgi:lysozyme family protein